MDDETGHHAMVRCMKAAALRHELWDKWLLPDVEQFCYLGLLLLLESVNEETGERILMLFWWAWFLRNDIVHGSGTGSIIGSAKFLVNYCEELRHCTTVEY
jgi:hypothetical protein